MRVIVDLDGSKLRIIAEKEESAVQVQFALKMAEKKMSEMIADYQSKHPGTKTVTIKKLYNQTYGK